MSTEADSTGEPAAAPPVATRPAVGRTVQREQSGVRSMVIVGLVAFVFITLGVVGWIGAYKRAEQGKAVVARVDAPPAALPTDPNNPPSPAYQNLVVEQNAQQVEAGGVNGVGVVVPPLIGGTTDSVQAQPPQDAAAAPPTRYYSDVSAGDASRGGDTGGARRHEERVREYAAGLKASGADRGVTLAAQSITTGASMMDAPESSRSVESEAGRAEAPIDVPLLVVLPAITEVGANSDYPGQVIVRLGARYEGVKLLGDVQVTGSGASDRLVLRFNQMLVDGVLYSVDAFAVDANTRIPAIKGDLNRHVLYNVVTQSSAAFLAGYGNGLSQQRVAVGDDATAAYLGGLTASTILRQEGANVLSSQLGRMQHRRTTVTLPAGRMIGIVVVERPGTQSRGARASAVATPGVPAPGAMDFGGVPNTPPPNAVAY